MIKRLIIRIEINVSDINRAKVIKEAIEAQANALPEPTDVNIRYDEMPNSGSE